MTDPIVPPAPPAPGGASTPALDRLRGRTRLRKWSSIVLVFLTAIVVILASLATWTRGTVLNTDNYVRVVEAISTDPAVIAAVSERVAAQTVVALDVQARVADVLPPRAAPLAATITRSIQEGLERVMGRTLSSPEFQRFFAAANRQFHQRLVALLRGDATNATLEDGVLTIDLFPLVVAGIADLQASGIIPAQVPLPDLSADEDMEAARVRLGTALGKEVPADLGKVVVTDAATLTRLQNAVRIMDALVYILIGLAILLGALSIIVSTRRWRTAAFLALAIVATVPIIRLLIEAIGDALVGAIKNPTGSATLGAIYAKLENDLFAWLTLIIVIGLVMLLIAWSEGRRPSGGALPLSAADGRSLAIVGIGVVIIWLVLGIEFALLAAVILGVYATIRLPRGRITA